jgi:hypothetical protein
MRKPISISLTVCGALLVCIDAASAQTQTPSRTQTQTQTQTETQPKAAAGDYRGTIVCEKIAIARDIVRVPFDLIVRGQGVEFARPVFNLRGILLGSELGSGNVDAGGKLHISARRVFFGQTVESEYDGTLTAKGGTLSGRQWWHGTNGEGSRSCYVALVAAPQATKP